MCIAMSLKRGSRIFSEGVVGPEAEGGAPFVDVGGSAFAGRVGLGFFFSFSFGFSFCFPFDTVSFASFSVLIFFSCSTASLRSSSSSSDSRSSSLSFRFRPRFGGSSLSRPFCDGRRIGRPLEVVWDSVY